MAVTASISGSLSDRIGSRIPATIGMAILALGLFLLSRVELTTPLGLIVGMLLLTGLGIGLFTSPNNSAVLGAVPSQRRGVANGILGTARTLGMLLGIALVGAVFATVLGMLGDSGPSGIVQAAGTGFLVASIIAVIGAATSATRPTAPQAAAKAG
jgi:MFS family permease